MGTQIVIPPGTGGAAGDPPPHVLLRTRLRRGLQQEEQDDQGRRESKKLHLPQGLSLAWSVRNTSQGNHEVQPGQNETRLLRIPQVFMVHTSHAMRKAKRERDAPKLATSSIGVLPRKVQLVEQLVEPLGRQCAPNPSRLPVQRTSWLSSIPDGSSARRWRIKLIQNAFSSQMHALPRMQTSLDRKTQPHPSPARRNRQCLS